MFERLGGIGFVLYFLLIGLALAAIAVSARVASSSLAELTIARNATSQASASRVTVGLEAQTRQAQWQSAGQALERPPVPDVSAATLAKGLDAAENHRENHPLPPVAKSKTPPIRARVAAWMKRGKPKAVTNLAEESPNRLIERSLRGEM